MINLFQHRGEPDPELAKEKQAQKLARQKQRQDKSKTQQKRKQQILDKVQQLKSKQNQSQNQQIQEQKKQQTIQAQQHVQQETQQRIQNTQKQFSKSNKEYSDTLHKMEKSAPTDNAKSVMRDVNKDLDDINKLPAQTTSAEAKLTPEERKRRKARELEELNSKYDDIEKKQLKKLKTPEERKWFRKNFSELKRAGLKAGDNVMDLFGYKAVYDDIVDVTKYLIGKK